jgi:hypothetical protein
MSIKAAVLDDTIQGALFIYRIENFVEKNLKIFMSNTVLP